jgi:uncharacterized iron-regulated membrane protein
MFSCHLLTPPEGTVVNNIPWIRLLGRVFLITGIGLAISLLAGTLISIFPDSALEGMNSAKFVTGIMAVLIYFLLLRKRGTRKLNGWVFDLHSVLGLATGLLLSVIFLSGVLLLYQAEFDVLKNSSLEIEQGDSHTSVDAWVEAVAAQTDLNVSNRIDISWPDSRGLPAVVAVSGPNGFERFYVDPVSARVMEGRASAGMALVRRIHVGLNLGKPGHWLVGSVALAAVWLCIGGLSMGRNVFREWYVLRFRSGLQIFLSDLHKRFGLWLLPFIALNAFAGMLAAFSGVFGIGPMQTRFDGDYSALYEAVGSPQSVERTEPAPTPPISGFVDMAKNTIPDLDIYSIRVIGYGDANTIVSVKASRKGDLAPNGTSLRLNIRASTGEVLYKKEISKVGIFERISLALASFHLAEYGGKGIRSLHAITAVLVSLIPFLGMGMWFLRRRRRRAHNGP